MYYQLGKPIGYVYDGKGGPGFENYMLLPQQFYPRTLLGCGRPATYAMTIDVSYQIKAAKDPIYYRGTISISSNGMQPERILPTWNASN